MIGIKARQTKRFQQRFEPQENFVLTTPKNIRQDGTRMVIDRMPQPAWILFVANKRPHLINFRFAGLLNVHNNLFGVQCAQQRCVHRCQQRFFLLEFTEYGVGADPKHPCGIANPTGVEAHINDLVLHLGQTPAVAIVKQKTPLSTRGILAEVTLFSPACFAAFDDLLAVTVGAPDCNECHEPLLTSAYSQDWAQCDINLSPSPLLEHYQQNYDAVCDAGKSSLLARW